jgi:predicted transcriptional regulator
MDETPHPELSPRERQIMSVVYRQKEATAEQIRAEMQDPPSNSAVRATIRILEDKGVLDHRKEGRTHVYYPTTPPDEAGTSALERLKETFFEGSVSKAVSTLLSSSDLSEEELEEISDLIERARRQDDDS